MLCTHQGQKNQGQKISGQKNYSPGGQETLKNYSPNKKYIHLTGNMLVHVVYKHLPPQ